MKKRLTCFGNSFGILIEKPILALLDINPDTELTLTTDGHRLIIEPLRVKAEPVPKSSRLRASQEHPAKGVE